METERYTIELTYGSSFQKRCMKGLFLSMMYAIFESYCGKFRFQGTNKNNRVVLRDGSGKELNIAETRDAYERQMYETESN